MKAPQTRKHLSADALFRMLRSDFAAIDDHRPGRPDISLRDALMSAFAMFSLKSPSLLAFDRERTEGNLQRVYGMQRVPCDTAMREILDPVEPASLRPSFKHVFRALQRGKALEAMVFVEGHYLLALDGTGYFSSKQIHCASCLETHHRNGTITYSHQMLGAALMHPDKREVIPLMPEPIIKQDGTEKNDGERNAAKRFITKLRQDHPHLKVIVTEDSLSSNAPHLEVLQAHNLHYILGVKEGDHAYLFEQVAVAEQAGRMTYYDRDDPETGLRHRFRFVSDVPLNASHADLRVNFLECWEWDKDKVHHFSWITDLRVNKGTVYQIMRGGRARWRMENETFNTLKNQGYHFEHNFGHGYQHLSVVFAMLMMLAFFVDQVQQLCCPLFQAVWAKLGSKRRLWERMRALFYDYALASMRQLFAALLYGWKKTAPIFAVDSS
ncbi:transposase [Candidatus Parcubacteria bacterium]|nr:MAG: transposase [Candidatus Parcubacteria bacterium]